MLDKEYIESAMSHIGKPIMLPLRFDSNYLLTLIDDRHLIYKGGADDFFPLHEEDDDYDRDRKKIFRMGEDVSARTVYFTINFTNGYNELILHVYNLDRFTTHGCELFTSGIKFIASFKVSDEFITTQLLDKVNLAFDVELAKGDYYKKERVLRESGKKYAAAMLAELEYEHKVVPTMQALNEQKCIDSKSD